MKRRARSRRTRHASRRKRAGDPYQEHLEKERQKALDDVEKDGRDRWLVDWKGRKHEVSINRRTMTYNVRFSDGTAVQVQKSGSGATSVTNHTGDRSKGHAASEMVKKIDRYEEAMSMMYSSRDASVCRQCQAAQERSGRTASMNLLDEIVDKQEVMYTGKYITNRDDLGGAVRGLLVDVYSELADRLEVDGRTEQALRRFKRIVNEHDRMQPEDLKNQIAKAANLLGLDPGIFF